MDAPILYVTRTSNNSRKVSLLVPGRLRPLGTSTTITEGPSQIPRPPLPPKSSDSPKNLQIRSGQPLNQAKLTCTWFILIWNGFRDSKFAVFGTTEGLLENAIFPQNILTTWEEPFRDSLYLILLTLRTGVCNDSRWLNILIWCWCYSCLWWLQQCLCPCHLTRMVSTSTTTNLWAKCGLLAKDITRENVLTFIGRLNLLTV